jgi:hypothetical protein
MSPVLSEMFNKPGILIDQCYRGGMSDPERRQLCLAIICYAIVDFTIYSPQDVPTKRVYGFTVA